jgi:hypothetical protein
MVPRHFGQIPAFIRSDRSLLADLLRENGELLRLLPPPLRDDRDLVLAALSSSGDNLHFASERLRDDPEVVLTAIRREEDWAAINAASDRLLTDPEFSLRAVLLNAEVCTCFPEVAIADRERLLEAVAARAGALHLASEGLRDDPEIVRLALIRDPSLLAIASERLRDDEGLVRFATGISPSALRHASLRLRDDRELLRSVLAGGPSMIRYASARLRDDPELIREALRRGVNGDRSVRQDEIFDLGVPEFGVHFLPGGESPLVFASDRLRDDPELVLFALETGYSPLSAVSNRLRDDLGLMRRAVTLRPHDLRHASDRLRDDPDLVRLAVHGDPTTIQHASDRLRSDLIIGLEVVLASKGAIRLLHPSIRRHPDLVRAATPTRVEVMGILRENEVGYLTPERLPTFVEDLPDWVWSDRDLVTAAVRSNGLLLAWASPELRADPEIAAVAVRRDPDALAHVLGGPRSDPEIAGRAFTQRELSFVHVPSEVRVTLLSDPMIRGVMESYLIDHFGAPVGDLAPMSPLEERRARPHLRRLSLLLDRVRAGQEIPLLQAAPGRSPTRIGLLHEVRSDRCRVRYLTLRRSCGTAFITVMDSNSGRQFGLRSCHPEENRVGEHLCEYMKFDIRQALLRQMSPGPSSI